MISLSVAIVTQDEADRIGSCINSVRSFADEVVVIDSGSTDETVSIARSLNARVLINPWPGYAEQKQFAVDQCRNDWVLILDADERVPKKTARHIEKMFSDNSPDKSLDHAGYSFMRQNFFHKKWIKRCGWWPDKVLRLVNRKSGCFSNHMVHEQWLCKASVYDLDLVIEHSSFRNYAGLITKMQAYSTLAAEQMYGQGKKAFWWSSITHGFWTFLTTYLFKLGFLEGFDGFMIALMNAQGSFMKYAKLREIVIYRVSDKLS